MDRNTQGSSVAAQAADEGKSLNGGGGSFDNQQQQLQQQLQQQQLQQQQQQVHQYQLQQQYQVYNALAHQIVQVMSRYSSPAISVDALIERYLNPHTSDRNLVIYIVRKFLPNILFYDDRTNLIYKQQISNSYSSFPPDIEVHGGGGEAAGSLISQTQPTEAVGQGMVEGGTITTNPSAVPSPSNANAPGVNFYFSQVSPTAAPLHHPS
jgi:hypothetical protein